MRCFHRGMTVRHLNCFGRTTCLSTFGFFQKSKSSETGNRTPGICVTGRDVTNYTISDHLEYLGFDPSTSCLLSTHASDCANTPWFTTPGGFEPPRTWCTHLAGEPLNHSGKVSFSLAAASTGSRNYGPKNTRSEPKKKKCTPCRGIEPRASA